VSKRAKPLESAYDCGDLVEFSVDAGATENSFGIIREITFRKYDADNHVESYSIHLLNRAEVVHAVATLDIVRVYRVSE
jgi:hypothetical protein